MSFGRRVATLAFVLIAPAALADPFEYHPPGQLVSGSGQGRADETIYAPELRFPVEIAPAFLNSQVWGKGGMNGGGGSQCDTRNYSYPWKDNYCETRDWEMPLCPAGKGHQGQDIRPSTCENRAHWALAVKNGTITQVGSYSVYLTAEDGTRFDYLHMSDVAVRVGDEVVQGAKLGKISNVFNGGATTIHLHFNIKQNIVGVGPVYVPPYMSLVAAYEQLLGIAETPAVTPPSQTPDAGASSGASTNRDAASHDAASSDAALDDAALGDAATNTVTVINHEPPVTPKPPEPPKKPSCGGCGCSTTAQDPQNTSVALALLVLLALYAARGSSIVARSSDQRPLHQSASAAPYTALGFDEGA